MPNTIERIQHFVSVEIAECADGFERQPRIVVGQSCVGLRITSKKPNDLAAVLIQPQADEGLIAIDDKA